MAARRNHRRGRPRSTSSETQPEARAYVQSRWGEELLSSADAVGWVEVVKVAGQSHAAEMNRAFREARALRLLLDDRVLSSRLAEAERMAARIDGLFQKEGARRSGAPSSGGGTTRKELQPLAGAVRAAFDSLRAATREFSLLVAVAGTLDARALRRVASTLEARVKAYENEPTRKNANALDDVTADYDLELRVKVAKAVVARVPGIGADDADATTWAHWAISVGLDETCRSEEFATSRRSLWRRVLQRAR